MTSTPTTSTPRSAPDAASPKSSTASDSPAVHGILPAALALLTDAVLVVAFVALGQDQHASTAGLGRLLLTASPFLLGLAVTTAVTRGHRTWSRVWPHGVVTWLGTVAIGMACRVWWMLGGAPLSFIMVATVVLGVFLLGRRAVTAAFARRRR